MINDVVLEGIVVRAWEYTDDLLLRLACYRDPDLPQKPLSFDHRNLFCPGDNHLAKPNCKAMASRQAGIQPVQ